VKPDRSTLPRRGQPPNTAARATAVRAVSPEDAYLRLAAIAVFGVTLLRLMWLAAGTTDLYPDEAQYWLWSRTPDFGYFSKPPLVAWIIAATTAFAGDEPFGVRLAAPFLHAGTALVILAIGRRLYDARTGCWSAVVYITLPAVSISAGIISTDVPLLLCWAVALYAFVRAREEAPAGGGWRWWIAVGAAAGVGLLAKYAMAYWLLSALIFVLAVREERRHLPRLLAATALALAIYSPNFFWNLNHQFVSYAHTEANANLGGTLFHPIAFLEFFGSQFGVFGPVFFGALIVVVATARRSLAGRREQLLAVFALPTLAMMLIVAFLSRAQPNWSAPTYVSAVVLVVAFLVRHGRAALVSGSVALHVVAAVLLLNAREIGGALGVTLPAKYEPLHRLRGWAALGRSVSMQLAERPGAVLVVDGREDIASLIYYVRPHPFDAVEWNPDGWVRDHFQMTSDLNRYRGEGGQEFLFVSRDQTAQSLAPYFESVQSVGRITIPIGPDRARRYSVFALKGFKGYR
jgi:4-amino-4-deoxy-L-arabinose transferase-like glycosyltransferase